MARRKRSSALRVGYAISVIGLWAGITHADAPPIVEPGGAAAVLNESIVFYASFDHGRVDADLALGRAEPLGVGGTLRFVEGRFGGGLLLGAGGGGARLEYAARDHLDFTRPGALSFWIRPRSWIPPSAERRGYVRFLTVPVHPASFVVQRMGFDRDLDRPERLIVGVFGLPGVQPTYVEMSGSEGWRSDRWHLVVANWDRYGFEVSLDGQPFERRAAADRLDYGALVEDGGAPVFVLGNNTEETTAIDELTLYAHPLEMKDVAKLHGGR